MIENLTYLYPSSSSFRERSDLLGSFLNPATNQAATVRCCPSCSLEISYSTKILNRKISTLFQKEEEKTAEAGSKLLIQLDQFAEKTHPSITRSPTVGFLASQTEQAFLSEVSSIFLLSSFVCIFLPSNLPDYPPPALVATQRQSS